MIESSRCEIYEILVQKTLFNTFHVIRDTLLVYIYRLCLAGHAKGRIHLNRERVIDPERLRDAADKRERDENEREEKERRRDRRFDYGTLIRGEVEEGERDRQDGNGGREGLLTECGFKKKWGHVFSVKLLGPRIASSILLLRATVEFVRERKGSALHAVHVHTRCVPPRVHTDAHIAPREEPEGKTDKRDWGRKGLKNSERDEKKEKEGRDRDR